MRCGAPALSWRLRRADPSTCAAGPSVCSMCVCGADISYFAIPALKVGTLDALMVHGVCTAVASVQLTYTLLLPDVRVRACVCVHVCVCACVCVRTPARVRCCLMS